MDKCPKVAVRGTYRVYIDEKESNYKIMYESSDTCYHKARQKKKKTMPYKWARQGKVQLKIKLSIVQFSTNHSLQSLSMNIHLDDEIDAAAAKSNILLQFERVIVISFWMKLTQF